MENPLDRFGLSPFASVEEITTALRERAEEAPEEERAALREAWEELTMHPRARLRAAIFTSPPANLDGARERRPPPLSPELVKAPEKAASDPDAPLSGVAWIDLVPRPLVAVAIETGRPKDVPRVLPRLAEDPLAALATRPRTFASGPHRGAEKT